MASSDFNSDESGLFGVNKILEKSYLKFFKIYLALLAESILDEQVQFLFVTIDLQKEKNKKKDLRIDLSLTHFL